MKLAKMKKYRFTISMDCDVDVEAENREDARIQVIDKMHNGYYDQLLNPDASAYVDDGEEVSDNDSLY